MKDVSVMSFISYGGASVDWNQSRTLPYTCHLLESCLGSSCVWRELRLDSTCDPTQGAYPPRRELSTPVSLLAPESFLARDSGSESAAVAAARKGVLHQAGGKM